MVRVIHSKGADRPFQGKNAFVLGGSGGIGRAIARELCSRGLASITIHGSKDGPKLALAVKEARDKGVKATSLACGLESLSDFSGRLGFLSDTDILVVSFGPFLYKPLTETTRADWEKTVLLNLALPGMLVSAVLPGMMARGFGRILLFGGTRTDEIRAFRMNAAYASAKTALNVLAKSVSDTYAPYGVACTVVCPGFVDTEYVEPGERARLAAMTPDGKLQDPADVAAAAVDALEGESSGSGNVLSLYGNGNP